MDKASSLAVAVLAAGGSTRFGRADKLAATLHGKPLGNHICDTLAPLPFGWKWVITAAPSPPYAEGLKASGFEVLVNERAREGIGTSLALAARSALQTHARGLLVCLADMPLISRKHLDELGKTWATCSIQAIVASRMEDIAMPPAIFPRMHFEYLATRAGDVGAKSILDAAVLVDCDWNELQDIDTPADLQEIERRRKSGN